MQKYGFITKRPNKNEFFSYFSNLCVNPSNLIDSSFWSSFYEDKNHKNPTHDGWERCSIVLARYHCAWAQALAHGNSPLRFHFETQPSWVAKTKKQFVRYPMFCTTEMVFIVFASNDVFSCEARVMMAGYVAVSLLTGTKPWQQHESSKSENISVITVFVLNI